MLTPADDDEIAFLGVDPPAPQIAQHPTGRRRAGHRIDIALQARSALVVAAALTVLASLPLQQWTLRERFVGKYFAIDGFGQYYRLFDPRAGGADVAPSANVDLRATSVGLVVVAALLLSSVVLLARGRAAVATLALYTAAGAELATMAFKTELAFANGDDFGYFRIGWWLQVVATGLLVVAVAAQAVLAARAEQYR